MERPGHMPQEIALPEPLGVNFETIPKRLQAYDHFVVWKYECVDGDLKKPPFDPKTGKRASVGRCETWGSFADAQRAYETGSFAGVGIVLAYDTGIVGIDIDHCIKGGQITPEAQHIVRAVNSYAETSPSGTGVRIMLEGKLPAGVRRRGSIEMYDNTGGGVKDERRPTTVYQVARSDQQVLQKAFAAKNGETFRRYYYGDTSLWEGAGARHASQSEADFTLVLMLLYWTNNDTNQVDRLFRQSGLMREKWHRPIKGSETYGDRLIQDALRKGKQR